PYATGRRPLPGTPRTPYGARRAHPGSAPRRSSRAARRGAPPLRRPSSSGEAPSPVVDAAPPHAIVGIAAQAVGPRVVLIGVRASEHLRQLARGELQSGPQRHDRNPLVVLGAHR